VSDQLWNKLEFITLLCETYPLFCFCKCNAEGFEMHRVTNNTVYPRRFRQRTVQSAGGALLLLLLVKVDYTGELISAPEAN